MTVSADRRQRLLYRVADLRSPLSWEARRVNYYGLQSLPFWRWSVFLTAFWIASSQQRSAQRLKVSRILRSFKLASKKYPVETEHSIVETW